MTNHASEVVYIDSAHSVASMKARRQPSFFEVRHRSGFFSRVWGVHPQVGILEGHRAGPISFRRFSSRQMVLDGFVPGPKLPRWRRPLDFVCAHARLVRVMVRIAKRPAVRAVFASDTFYNGLLATIVGRLSGKAVMVAAYQNQDELYAATGLLSFPRILPSRRLELLVQRLVLRSADYVDAPTLNMRDHVLRRGARSNRIGTVPVAKFVVAAHADDPATRRSPDTWLRARGIPIGRPTMIQVGRLLSLKHSDDGVQAMLSVLDQVPEAIGLVAGEGPLRPQLEAMIAAAGMTDRLFLLGVIDQEVLGSLIPGTVAISPLTGMALIETSLGGSPAVAYDRDWQPEFVHSGKNGFIVPYRDHRAMAERALHLIRNPDERRRLGEQARRDALAFADPEVNGLREREALAAAIAGHAARRRRR